MSAWEEKEIQRLVHRVEQAEKRSKELEGWGKRAYRVLSELVEIGVLVDDGASPLMTAAPDSIKSPEAA